MEITEKEIKSFIINKTIQDETKSIDNHYPKISIITCSFNQATYLERTILSVLNQNYPNLEYIMIDGGSTDGSVDIIKRYQKYFSYWVSETDNGQYNALNKGLEEAKGELIAWQNSDDIYLPNTLFKVAQVFIENPLIDLIFGNIYLIDVNDHILAERRYYPFYLKPLLYGYWNISTQAAFWSRRAMMEIGRFKEFQHTADLDWFIRIGKASKHIYFLSEFLGCYRIHPETKLSTISFNDRWKTLVSILTSHGVPVKHNIPWKMQFKAQKLQIFLKKCYYHILQHEFEYIYKALLRRIGIGRWNQ